MSSSLPIAGGGCRISRVRGLDFSNPISSSAIKWFAPSWTVCISVLPVHPVTVSNSVWYVSCMPISLFKYSLSDKLPYVFLIYYSCWHIYYPHHWSCYWYYIHPYLNCTLVSCATWFGIPWSGVTSSRYKTPPSRCECSRHLYNWFQFLLLKVRFPKSCKQKKYEELSDWCCLDMLEVVASAVYGGFRTSDCWVMQSDGHVEFDVETPE